MNKSLKIWIFILLAFNLPLGIVFAQSEDELNLNLSKDFGFSSGTGKIQGTFSMRVSGPDSLTRVEFLIDGEKMQVLSSPPFRFQFKTDNYPDGVHILSAIGYTSDGDILNSNERRVEFITAQEGWQQALKIILPLFGLIFVVSAASMLIPIITGKGKKSSVQLGSPRSYGMLGGAICPKCGRPFSIHIFGMNIVIGKVDRCPHCGRWSLVQRVSQEELRRAELAEIEQSAEDDLEALHIEESRLRKDLEESKYQDL